MDEDNLSKAIMIGVTTLVGVMTVSAIIIFFNSSLNIVKSVGSGKDFGNVYRNDIESTLLMSDTGNYIKGTSVVNLLSYYEEDVNVTVSIYNIKYIDENGDVKVLDLVSMDSNDVTLRNSAYNKALRYIMDNQDFTITVEDLDTDLGSKNITIRGV